MSHRLLTIAFLASLLGCSGLAAQTTSCGSTKLICLFPTAFHTNPPTFNFFNEAFATQIGQLSLATPASGFILTFDKQTRVYTATQESFGPLVAERAETLGRHRAYLAFTFQRMVFSEIDGNSLSNLPILFFYPNKPSAKVATYTQNFISANVNQYVIYGTYGLTSRLDVSVAIPFLRVSMGSTTGGTEYSTTTPATTSFSQDISGSASGIGDAIFAAKGTVYKTDKYGIAVGGELRVPSGDEQNFLGSGAVGIKPYIVFSRRGRVAPHINLAYQWNSSSPLAVGADGKQGPLPPYFGYILGADVGVSKRLTLAADFVGQHYFNAALLTTTQDTSAVVNNQQVSFSSIAPAFGSYNLNALALGLKANPWKQMLILANITIKVNDGGLRATVVPFVGISYTF